MTSNTIKRKFENFQYYVNSQCSEGKTLSSKELGGLFYTFITGKQASYNGEELTYNTAKQKSPLVVPSTRTGTSTKISLDINPANKSTLQINTDGTFTFSSKESKYSDGITQRTIYSVSRTGNVETHQVQQVLTYINGKHCQTTSYTTQLEQGKTYGEGEFIITRKEERSSLPEVIQPIQAQVVGFARGTNQDPSTQTPAQTNPETGFVLVDSNPGTGFVLVDNKPGTELIPVGQPKIVQGENAMSNELIPVSQNKHLVPQQRTGRQQGREIFEDEETIFVDAEQEPDTRTPRQKRKAGMAILKGKKHKRVKKPSNPNKVASKFKKIWIAVGVIAMTGVLLVAGHFIGKEVKQHIENNSEQTYISQQIEQGNEGIGDFLPDDGVIVTDPESGEEFVVPGESTPENNPTKDPTGGAEEEELPPPPTGGAEEEEMPQNESNTEDDSQEKQDGISEETTTDNSQKSDLPGAPKNSKQSNKDLEPSL